VIVTYGDLMYKISNDPKRVYEVETDMKLAGGPGSGRHPEGGATQEPHPDTYHETTRVGAIGKFNLVNATDNAKEFAKGYIGLSKGDEKVGAEFVNKYENVGKQTGRNEGDVYKEKGTDNHFVVHKEQNDIGKTVHYIRQTNKP
jgi:hypothetical protein